MVAGRAARRDLAAGSRSIQKLALGVSLGVLLGCGSPDGAGGPEIRDSLGVTLIEYGIPFAELPGDSWSADSAPLFVVGDSAADLHEVRTAAFQSNGAVVIANGGYRQVLFCGPDDGRCHRAGAEGEGPGEFLQLASLSVGPGDSVFAFDARERRLSVFGPGGTFVRAISLRGGDTLGLAEEVGVLGSGELLGAFRRRTAGTGLVRDSLLIVLFDAGGDPVRSLAVFPHIAVDWGPHAIPGGGGTATFPLPVPLSAVSGLALADEAVYVAVPDESAVVRLTVRGQRRVTRAPAPSHLFTEAERDSFFAGLSTRRLDPRELDVLRGIHGRDIRPPFGLAPLTAKLGERPLVVTDAGGVWLRPFRLPGDPANTWVRLGPDGTYEGDITFPPGFRLTAVRGDAALGVHQDTLGVERVEILRIRRTR